MPLVVTGKVYYLLVVVVMATWSMVVCIYQCNQRDCRGRDCMVVGFTITYAISAYHLWCCEFESRSGRGVQHNVVKFVTNLRQKKNPKNKCNQWLSSPKLRVCLSMVLRHTPCTLCDKVCLWLASNVHDFLQVLLISQKTDRHEITEIQNLLYR